MQVGRLSSVAAGHIVDLLEYRDNNIPASEFFSFRNVERGHIVGLLGVEDDCPGVCRFRDAELDRLVVEAAKLRQMVQMCEGIRGRGCRFRDVNPPCLAYIRGPTLLFP